MSRRPLKNELPRDAHVMQALRRELHRNSRQITQAFWQEFEQIRNRQRGQLAQERTNREQLSTLMRNANLETQRQAEALGRSISSHGVNPLAPSPRMLREPPAVLYTAEQMQQEVPDAKADELPPSAVKVKESDAQVAKKTPLLKPTSVQLPSVSSRLPRAPPSSRATIIPRTPSSRTTPRSTPDISKLRLVNKPKK